MKLTRREMLRELMMAGLSATAASAVLAGCGAPAATDNATAGNASASNTAANAAPGSASTGAPIKIGFIPLTDCASIVVAQEMGLFKKYGVEVDLQKQANWLAVRDKVTGGELDASHCLFGMPFSIATDISKAQGKQMKIAMVLDNNGQASALSNKAFPGLKYGDFPGLRAGVDKLRATKQPTFAMTFPGGTHDMWLHLMLAGAGIDPKSVTIKVIPPPQMVANMTAGNMDGFNVGEPWPGKAVADKIGFTFIATQDLWKNHPEKALVVNADFAETRKEDLKKVMKAILEASQYIDDKKNNDKVAEIIGTKAYTGADPKVIADRLKGIYTLGGANGMKDFSKEKNYMLFHNNGETNFPRRSHALWFLTQYVRFGRIKEMPADYEKMVDDILMQDLYKEVAGEMKIKVPTDDMTPFTVQIDKVVFNPTKPMDALKTYVARENFLKSKLV